MKLRPIQMMTAFCLIYRAKQSFSTHLDMGRDLVNLLTSWNCRIYTVFLVDSQFMVDGATFLSGTMAALSVMANLEMPHVNVLNKMDLLSKTIKTQLDKFLAPDPVALLGDVTNESAWGRKYRKLSVGFWSGHRTKFLPVTRAGYP